MIEPDDFYSDFWEAWIESDLLKENKYTLFVSGEIPIRKSPLTSLMKKVNTQTDILKLSIQCCRIDDGGDYQEFFHAELLDNPKQYQSIEIYVERKRIAFLKEIELPSEVKW